MTCSNRPCSADVEPDTAALCRDERTGALVPLCAKCARLFVTAHPDRFTRVR